jgi:HK97 family phage prohead protease
MKTFERRMAVAGLEVRESSDELTLTGYASTFNEPYDMGWYTETVDAEAFKRTLARTPDVRLLINHEGLPLARTTSGTLTLDTDSQGLRPTASLDLANPKVQELASTLRRGDANQMSFAFRANEDEWNKDMSQRTLRELDLNDGDVSVVTYPANPNASAALRSDGPAVDAMSSALRTLETRGASALDMANLLDRARAYFRALPVDDAPGEPADAESVCVCCGTDCCDCTDPECDGTCCDTCPGSPARAVARTAHEFRLRLLSLAG